MLKRTFFLGYVEHRKAEVNIKLYDTKHGKVFSADGEIKNNSYGQNLDELNEYFGNHHIFKEIYKLWKKYHLNDLNAGTVKQENAIKEQEYLFGKMDYSAECEYLKSINMFEVPLNGKVYKYGHQWLFREIPLHDLNKIENLILKGRIV